MNQIVKVIKMKLKENLFIEIRQDLWTFVKCTVYEFKTVF